MPRSIDTHKPTCPCPACQGKRGERPEGILIAFRTSGGDADRLQRMANKHGLSPALMAKKLVRMAFIAIDEGSITISERKKAR